MFSLCLLLQKVGCNLYGSFWELSNFIATFYKLVPRKEMVYEDLKVTTYQGVNNWERLPLEEVVLLRHVKSQKGYHVKTVYK